MAWLYIIGGAGVVYVLKKIIDWFSGGPPPSQQTHRAESTRSHYPTQAYRNESAYDYEYNDYSSPYETRSYRTQSHTITPRTTRVVTPSYSHSGYGLSDTLTKSDLQNLMNKALRTQGSWMVNTEWLSRNGPDDYFRIDIMKRQRGKLTPTLKDRSGHSNNSLNGQYKGIFFMANVDKDGLPREQSPFGPRRLILPAYQLLSDCDLYFADFYCNKPNTKHYVQIVAVKPYTQEADFCDENLVKLEKHSNKFLRVISWSNTVQFNLKFWVEVMYSHQIDLNVWLQNTEARFYDVTSTGVKSKAGLLRYADCTVCDV